MVWFRSDLRIRDNPALHHACREADEGVVAAYAVCPAQWQAHDWGAARADFVLRHVAALSRELEGRRIALRMLTTPDFAGLPQRLLDLAGEHHCQRLFFNREYEVNELRRDAAVTSLFEGHGLQVRAFHDQLALEPDAVLTGSGGPYTVYTPFRRAWERVFEDSAGPEVLPAPRARPHMLGKPDPVPPLPAGLPGKARADLWPAGENTAGRRLQAFVERRLTGYHASRDLPAEEGTSRLSPYLACGVLSVRQCLRAALEANRGRLTSGDKGVLTWIGELIWREFYRHILIRFPRVSMHRPFRLETDRLPWRDDERGLSAWCEGRTGFPIVDAGMRQLAETGWMHNRLRMIVAMFLTKDLFIDWRLGERHFMRHLVDGDLASNNGGWQWSASTGTDAAPYFRIFNPVAQSRRWDPEGAFVRRFVPELADVPADRIHEPDEATRRRAGYPAPIVDHAAARAYVLSVFRPGAAAASSGGLPRATEPARKSPRGRGTPGGAGARRSE